MHIIVTATDDQWNELTQTRSDIDWKRVADTSAFETYNDAAAFFCLTEITSLEKLKTLDKPVLVNSVNQTLAELWAPANVYRINGWPGFLSRTVWEIAGVPNAAVGLVFEKLHVKIKWVKDEPGFITARIIAMIINEAYFALEDEVSSKPEIDTAMKLGTNYPFGPFEWANLIGVHHIASLLQKLQVKDTRYKPSIQLLKESAENN
ncbi:MAG: 3-hydroxyacyl-CoA dehydrogenase family protein [Ferruginibacter sp.]